MDPAEYESRIKDLELLFQISQKLDKSLDLKKVITPTLEAISDTLTLERGTISLLNRKTGQIQIEAARGLTPDQMSRGRYKPGEGITGQVVAKGKPLIIPNIADSPDFLDKTGARDGENLEGLTFLCVPIISGSEVIGALSADRPADSFRPAEADLRLLSIIASMIAQAVQIRQQAQEEKERLIAENNRLQSALKEQFKPSNMVGSSRAIREVYDLISQVSKSDATVLILGESGTGKELIAQAIHYHSLRADGPFIRVNCSALPESVIESELFGHEKGAFTGAVTTRKGRFEMAHKGTIFLDEIGDLPPAVQVKILRVLQEREIERVGGSQTIKTDVRILAATNADLEKKMAAGEFREDLYYRLNVFPIHVPPLRDRTCPITLLADHFAEKYGSKNFRPIRRISTSAINLMTIYHWPGNVRELENCIERAVILSSDGVIHGSSLPPSLQSGESTGTQVTSTLKSALDKLEKEMVLEVLKETGGNQTRAAGILGISERQMGLRVTKYGIDPKKSSTLM